MSNSGAARYTPRDRSPPRLIERRPSAAYSSAPLSARITDPGHRTNDSHGYSNMGRESTREPPKGPKLDPKRAARYGRGRGYAGRGESRERDFRDPMDSSISRRGKDRDWSRLDKRERRPSPTGSGRNRSRSPILRDSRDSRDARDFPLREMDISRARRDSREGPLSASSSISDALPSASFNNAGAFRGRGRGDREYVRSGRGNYVEERDVFRNRSRSRDRIWDKKGRDGKEPREQDHVRRDDAARKEWDERERDVEKHRRELVAFRPESRNSTTTQVAPSTSIPSSTLSLHRGITDRNVQTTQATSVESGRRPSGSLATSHVSSAKRDAEKNDLLFQRGERERQAPRMTSPPPQAPPVPAYGSIVSRTNSVSQSGGVPKDHTKDNAPSTLTPRSPSLDIAKEAPSGPKAKIPSHAPTGPKALQPSVEGLGNVGRGSDSDREKYRLSNLLISNSGTLNETETRSEHQTSSPNVSSHAQGHLEKHSSRASGHFPTPQTISRHKSLQLLQPSGRRESDEQIHQASFTPSLYPASPVKAAPYENASQHSPVKIPTGPRADRTVSTIRQPGSPPLRGALIRTPIPPRQTRPTNPTWTRPGLSQHTPRGPSIMNTVPTKRDYAGEEKRFSLTERDPLKSAERSWSRPDSQAKEDPRDISQATSLQAERAVHKGSIEIDEASPNMKEEMDENVERQSPRICISEARKSVESNDLDVEDGLMDLDDDEFAEDERKFNSAIQSLNQRRPATPRHHPELLSLLEECDALASAAEDMSKVVASEVPKDGQYDLLPLGLPSPKLEETDKKGPEDIPMIPVSFVRSRQPTPPVDGLPFLASGPPTPFSEIEEIQQIPFHYDLMHARITEMLGNQREQMESENEEIRVDYAKKYKEWRMRIEDYEETKKAENPMTPTQSSPTLANMPLATPTPIIEGRRSAKNTSEFDLERVLRESAVTAQEDQDRRNRETKTVINLEKEAEIPQMLNRYEIEVSLFNDRNHLIESHLALDAFCFSPKPDDFTPEEQEIFLDNYLLSPKKWGTIAEALEGRNYQDCVRHYYHTKGEAQYKEKERVFSRLKKNRKGRGQQGRPKSNVLMPLYDGSTDFDVPQVPVTDTGRPRRRAAAPTFGEVADGEAVTAVGTPLRRGVPTAKSDTNGEPASEKPASKRGRTASVKEKPPKKGKALLLAAAPPPSPLKNEKEISRSKSKEPKIEGDQRLEETEGAQLLAGLHSIQTSQAVSQPGPSDSWLGTQQPLVNVSNPTSKPQPQQMNQELPQQQQQQQPQKAMQAGATSSYWSVPEETDFWNLVNHFGTDWQAIASHLKFKTHTMVRSF